MTLQLESLFANPTPTLKRGWILSVQRGLIVFAPLLVILAALIKINSRPGRSFFAMA